MEEVHQIIIDLKKAYDSVGREVLCYVLIEFGFPWELVRLIRMCLNETVSIVMVGKYLSDLFPVKNGLKESTRVGTLIVATIYLQLIQNRYMFRSFTLLHCSHQHCVQPVASDVEVVGYL